MANDEIDYEIFGSEMQLVEIELDPQETAIGEPGSFMYMNDQIEMHTIFGDGSNNDNNDFLSKLWNAGKRVLSGERLFMTTYTNVGNWKLRVAFAAPYPGKIIPFKLDDFGGKIICQKDAFLCAAKGVSIGIEWQKRLGTGFFGGEGFIMQKLEGDGYAFCHAGGHIIEKTLAPGQVLKIDTGCIVAYTKDIDFDIQFIGGIKNMIFGREGVFYATLKGPGKVWLQSLPISRLAYRIASYSYGPRKEEGSGLLDGFSRILDGGRN